MGHNCTVLANFTLPQTADGARADDGAIFLHSRRTSDYHTNKIFYAIIFDYCATIRRLAGSQLQNPARTNSTGGWVRTCRQQRKRIFVGSHLRRNCAGSDTHDRKKEGRKFGNLGQSVLLFVFTLFYF
jgi:hypothetical protein